MILILAFSCSKDNDKIIHAHMKVYNHYLLHDTTDSSYDIDIEYSFYNLNDSTILFKMYSFGDLVFTSIDSMQNGKIDSVNYQRYYLCHKGSNKPETRYFSANLDIAEDEYFNLDATRVYDIGSDSLEIMSFMIDNDFIDGDIRLFFNQKFGLLAIYSHSNFDASICRKSDDENNDKYRIELINKMMADTTFFPFPREVYPSPPKY